MAFRTTFNYAPCSSWILLLKLRFFEISKILYIGCAWFASSPEFLTIRLMVCDASRSRYAARVAHAV